ncbi:MAG: S41 family peptidase [Bacteroidales bacterium]|jgi:hypothetical protein|nr:S41 family peptidase [Bacteroidales bacterium]
MMQRYRYHILVFLLLLLAGLWFIPDREKGEPVENFEAFFRVFEEHYALAEVKQVDWNREYDYYSRIVTDSTSDDELFAIFRELLARLDDKHCYIYRFNEIYFSGFGLPSLNYLELLSFDFRVPADDFSLDVVEDHYLVDYEKSLTVMSLLPPVGIRRVFTTGWLRDSLAYIHMTEMSPKTQAVHQAIGSFIENYQDANGFIVDLRDNIGGYSLPVKALAGFFTDRKRLYAISRQRAPGGIHSFTEPDYWEIHPQPGSPYAHQPVALLVNENTQSAAELFTLMMKTIPTVKVFGDTTSGVFADTRVGRLPNGWEYRLSVRKTNDWQDRSYEGIGIFPDTTVVCTAADLERGVDPVMENAIHYLLNE